MILPDVNLLLYAQNSSFPQHEASRRWWEQTLAGPEAVRIPWTVILGFLRISTNPRAFPRPLSPAEAGREVEAWLAQPTVAVLVPGARHWEILIELLVSAQARGPLVSDAHLAALAIEHGAVLCTNDRDFTRFPGLKLRFPLEQPAQGT